MIKAIFSSCFLAIAVLFLQFFISGLVWPIDLGLALVIFLAFRYKIREFLPAVILLGVFWDAFFGLGMENLLAFTAVALSIRFLVGQMSLADPLTPAIIIFAGLALNIIFYFLGLKIYGWFNNLTLSPLGYFSVIFFLMYFTLNFLIVYCLFRIFYYRKLKFDYGL